MKTGTLDVEVGKNGLIALIATRGNDEARFMIDADFSDYLGRKLIRASKMAEAQKKSVPLS